MKLDSKVVTTRFDLCSSRRRRMSYRSSKLSCRSRGNISVVRASMYPSCSSSCVICRWNFLLNEPTTTRSNTTSVLPPPLLYHTSTATRPTYIIVVIDSLFQRYLEFKFRFSLCLADFLSDDLTRIAICGCLSAYSIVACSRPHYGSRSSVLRLSVRLIFYLGFS